MNMSQQYSSLFNKILDFENSKNAERKDVAYDNLGVIV